MPPSVFCMKCRSSHGVNDDKTCLQRRVLRSPKAKETHGYDHECGLENSEPLEPPFMDPHQQHVCLTTQAQLEHNMDVIAERGYCADKDCTWWHLFRDLSVDELSAAVTAIGRGCHINLKDPKAWEIYVGHLQEELIERERAPVMTLAVSNEDDLDCAFKGDDLKELGFASEHEIDPVYKLALHSGILTGICEVSAMQVEIPKHGWLISRNDEHIGVVTTYRELMQTLTVLNNFQEVKRREKN